MKKLLRSLWNKEFDRIGEAALLISILTFFSQILGLVRDRVFVSLIGPGQTLDIYYTAFRIPDLFYAIIGSILSITVLLPFFKEEYQDGQNKNKARIFLSQMFSGFIILATLFFLIIFLIFPLLSPLLAPGFSEAEHREITLMSRIILISPILLGISNLFSTVTQYTKRFIVYGLSPIVYNLGIISGVVLFYPYFGISGLGIGVLVGALAHILIQLPTLKKFELVPFLTLKIPWKSFGNLLISSVPRSLGLAASQIVLVILTSLATTISFGSVSVLNLAKNLQTVPLSLIGVSFSLAAFPILVQNFKEKKHEYLNQVIGPLKQIIFWSLPITALFIVLRAQLVRVAFGAGLFDWSHTRITAGILAILVTSVFAQGIIMLLVRAFYAAGKTWLPLITNLFSGAFIIILSFYGLSIYNKYPDLFSGLFSIVKIQNLLGAELSILALSFSVGTILNALILWILFCIQNKISSIILWKTFWQSILASFIVGLVAYLGNNIFILFIRPETLFWVVMQGLFSGGLAILVGIGILELLKSDEYLILKKILISKIDKYYARKA